ncbi:thyroid adenoma-associated protein homolog [Osmia lignaria lignaria]|uniref:thyroid adenoma-associated protein homolog n=1 Tax=Osmia lignaria lignaria TaxID=1437193 RepID=UPI00402B47AC
MYSQEGIKRDLNKLLELKRCGELDTEEELSRSNNEFWRNSVTYSTLESYLHNDDDQIKLNTLALIVESKKSTLKFTPKELDIIILFLRINFKEKLEFVPLIKKALKRMKESFAVMQRQCAQEEKMRYHYQKNCSSIEMNQEILDKSYRISFGLKKDIDKYCNAFRSLRNMCICSPDATYSRRKSSLQILLLMKDFLDNEFKHIAWEVEQMEALFQLMLLDTYESNKEMAFKLIKSVNPSLLQLDNEQVVYDIITVAVDLGNSIRPIDSITAAYMLKLSALSPIVQSILETRFGSTKSLDENTIETIILQLILILFKKLKQSLILAKENIVTTVTRHSLYGYLFCIRSLLEECDFEQIAKTQLWQDATAKLVSVCLELSCAVSVIVNNSSPEGHLPMDLSLQTINNIHNSSFEKQMVTPQMVLLCSWRTVKEVSLMFGLLAIKAPICEKNSPIGLLNKEQIIEIGEHLVTLLTETKHRGAFEQAHVGFNQLCTRLWRSNIAHFNQLPKIWLHQILIAITGIKEENSKLCATRRSAGVPFMIQALLSTEPRQYKDTKTTIFHSVMTILLEFTQLENVNLWDKVKRLIYRNSVFSEYENSLESVDGCCINENKTQVTEIRTHALNILRAVFRNSRLGEVVNDYVEDGLIAAIKSYDALTWAERNAATLLFSALIIRIFGVQRTKDHINLTTDNKMNFILFFEKYPNLLPFILDELQTFVAMNDNLIKSNVQSILLLLSRLYHRHSSEHATIQNKIDDLVTLVVQCARSTIFETRKLAARALVSVLTEWSVGDVLMRIIESVIYIGNDNLSLNLIHGYTLQIFEILKHFGFKQFQSFDKHWNRFLEKTGWILENLERQNLNPPCFLLATVYVNICSEMYKADETYFVENIPMLRTLVLHLLQPTLKQGPARELYQISIIKLIRGVAERNRLIPQNLLTAIYINSLKMPETQIVAWSTVTKIISEMQQDTMSMELLNYGIDEIRNSIQNLHRYSPELQDALFDFMYSSLTYLNKFELSSIQKMDICKFVLNEVRVNKKKNTYCERDCYLRLLGKSYVILVIANGNKEVFDLECTNDVYNNFCDHLWITSLNTDFRRSVFNIMHDLFLICTGFDEYRYVQVQWWTTVFQLLLDNNSEVRHEASMLIDTIPIDCTKHTNMTCTDLLLSKFYKTMHNSSPELICPVLFYWSIALIDDSDYEMDETDVFNKCTNYDFFEPLEISKICVEFLIRNMKSYLDNVLPDDVIDWVNSRLDIIFQKSITFRMLVTNYESYIPTFENKLHDILDPTYKNKLLQVLAYRQYKEIL